MKKIIIFLISISFSFVLHAQGIIGAWETSFTSENGDLIKSIVIFADGYQVSTTYNSTTGKFIRTNGGTWKVEGNTMIEKIEFHTSSPELVGTQVSFKVRISNNEIEFVAHKNGEHSQEGWAFTNISCSEKELPIWKLNSLVKKNSVDH